MDQFDGQPSPSTTAKNAGEVRVFRLAGFNRPEVSWEHGSTKTMMTMAQPVQQLFGSSAMIYMSSQVGTSTDGRYYLKASGSGSITTTHSFKESQGSTIEPGDMSLGADTP